MARNLPCNLPEEDRERVFKYFEESPWLDEAEEAQMLGCFKPVLFYETWGTKNMRECTCSHCGAFQVYDDEAVSFFKHHHNAEIDCPRCGNAVNLIALGRMRTFETLNKEELRFSIFRNAPDGGLMVVSGWGRREFTWYDLQPGVHFVEKERQYFAPGSRMRWKRTWTYDGLCNTGTAHPVGWEGCDYMKEPHNPTINLTSDGSYYVIAAERIEASSLKYCQVENWYFDRCKVWLTESVEPVRYVHRYLSAYTAYPRMEMACKLGFYAAVDDLVLENRKNAALLNWNAPSSWGWLRLSKADGRAFLKAEGNMDLLRLYKTAQKQSDVSSMSAFLNLAARVGGQENAGVLCAAVKKADCTFAEAINYVERHKELGRPGTVIQMWSDYLDMAKALEYDLTRRDVTLPKDLQQRHDNASATVAILGKQVKDQRHAERTKQVEAMYNFDFNGYSIVAPASVKSIVEEGKTLHHCVGGYAARHMDGKVDILFLRRSRRKGVPYITLELKHRKSSTDPVHIVQIHGYKNDSFAPGKYGNPKEQFAWFLDVWEYWLLHGSKRDKDGKPILPKRKEHSA